MTIQRPRLLLIDSYDSFAFNLAALCRIAIPDCSIHIIQNDRLTINELLPLLKAFSAIIIGPGPGSPALAEDIGIVKDIWRLAEQDLLPIFAVCLGFQSLVIEHGGELRRLRVVKHGQVSEILHSGRDIFQNLDKVTAVRYHSLYAVPHSKEIEPLAWSDDGVENDKILMAAKHRTRPFWGVQYHPESVLTDEGGLHILQNFWTLANEWSRERNRRPRALDLSSIGQPWPHLESPKLPPSQTTIAPSVLTSVVEIPGISVVEICEMLGVDDHRSPFILLDSAANPGRFSIVASLLPTSLQILYSVGDTAVTLKRGKTVTREPLAGTDIWSWISRFMQRVEAKDGCPDVPFWGGLIGSLSYELGVHSLDVPLRHNRGDSNPHHDLNLVYVQRCLVLDSSTNKVYIQSLLPDDVAWIKESSHRLQALSTSTTAICSSNVHCASAQVKLPNRSHYISKIEDAQDFLRSGDSYELCLTAHTHLSVSRCLSSWERYKLLRRSNPAPYSAYIRLQPTTFLSSSPERFLSYSRPPNALCQLRPIKGTIRKAPGITRAHAEEALRGSRKEVAENLMIVDLIRHDLHGVVGLDVDVKKFCGIEEYETVWQMVSVVEGRLPTGSSRSDLGWEVLKRSLPPGSMTGAPKKRSVEILQNLEDEDRSLYSGVFGYWCVGGGGDWSVAIRSCFKHEPESEAEQDLDMENWVIGAGGAITALSDPEAEWDEMLLKLQSVLGAFGASKPR
ncbi:para-aminobenzoate synthase [Gymnopus androsaceus JB14]|uniref:aminodeoxychorismate synthase n=1 Tax=Gymnopus androsaceus JB14 TaxID=1447944 RepID=A0A6A4HIT5_9AGAR|nr:para-aminobenzoate synthase [Gymnopus androsaceus JB14]